MAARHPDLSHARWRKSSYSSSTGQNCVEVATNLPGIVAIRDSKDPDGPQLIVAASGWRTFATDVRKGWYGL
jgi:Domain of unknown function (DUF397)